MFLDFSQARGIIKLSQQKMLLTFSVVVLDLIATLFYKGLNFKIKKKKKKKKKKIIFI